MSKPFEIRLVDRMPIHGVKRLADGYLAAYAKAMRPGIMIYDRSEFGLDGDEPLRVYRSEEDCRDPESLKTLAHAPVTLGHPEKFVDSSNWRQLAVGEVSTEAKWEDDHISLPLILKDAAAIQQLEDDRGMRELSPGYTCEIEFTDGVSPSGEPYDAIQRKVRINHLALVDVARGGPKCRIGDRGATPWGAAPSPTHAEKKGTKMSDTLQTILVDGLNVETTDAGAQAIKKLEAQLADERKAAADAQATFDTTLADKDTELGKKDAEIEELKGKVVDEAALDARAAKRADVIDAARKIAPDLDPKGKTEAEIRSSAVAAKLGDAAVADKSADYIAGQFDHLAASVADGQTETKPGSAFSTPVKAQDSQGGGWGKAVSAAGVARKEG